MANMDREVVIRAFKKFRSQIEAVVEASDNFIEKMYFLYAYKLFLKFSLKCIHPNYSFYCLRCVSVEFVLIYRPHPVLTVCAHCSEVSIEVRCEMNVRLWAQVS
jgi:hypothetical protein